MTLLVKDANNVTQSLVTTDRGSSKVPHHNIDMALLVRAQAGQVPGVRVIRRLGVNLGVDNTPEDVWQQGGVRTEISVAGSIDVSSTSGTDDNGTPSGARSIAITGLNASYVEQSETILTDGSTPVSSLGTYIRVLSAQVASGVTNVGTISVKKGSDVQLYIPIGECRANGTHFTVPAAHKAYIMSFAGGAYVGDNQDSAVRYTIWTRSNSLTVPEAFIDDLTTQPIPFPAIQLAAQTDIWVTAARVTGSGTVRAQAEYTLLLIADSFWT